MRCSVKRWFDWLIEHEKLLIGVTLVLALALVAQIKFCKSRVEPATESRQLNTEPNQIPSPSQTPSASTEGVSGTWDMSVPKKRGGAQNWILKLEQHGEQLKGVITSEGGDLTVTGTIKGRTISLSATRFGVTVEFPAVLQGDTMTGEMRALTVTRQWTAKRRM
jgi:hypothetical protein